MKLLQNITLIGLAVSTLWCCKKEGVLSGDTQSDIFDKDVWTDSVRTMQVLTSVYADLGPESYPTRINTSNSLSEFSDESDERWATTTNTPAGTFQKGNYSPSSLPDPFNNIWKNSYRSIRKANLFISRVDESPLSSGTKKRMKAEARFLRSWYYHLLMKHYAGVPLIDHVLSIDDDFNLPRNSYEECVNYIVKEMDEASPDLPMEYTGTEGQNYGRMTRGACLALKARVLLFAASPLFNGGAADANPVFGYPSEDKQRWTKAALAAKAVIDLNFYGLLQGEGGNNTTAEGFYNVFLLRVNKELIFARLSGSNRTYENSHLPSSRGGAYHNSPNGDYVDAYPMRNGMPINTPGSGYDPQNPYVNRDPRFYRSVIYNGALWLNQSTNTKQPVFTYFNAPGDGLSIPFVTPGTQTGYYNRKMMSEDVTGSTGGTQHFFPFLRYAEVLLNYAEALNESGQTTDAYEPMRQIRERAGLSPAALPAGLNQEQMRKFIRDERRIELAFEDHRFWDIRRWKIGASTYGTILRGMKIIKNANGTYSYEKFDLPKPASVFVEPKMNLLPIPAVQVNISDKLIQNPGW
ncbi:Starch-binding associating with outer membrane [Pedobacter steynii]|uniref:Starch-binding associating with outer membrane n=1 Tax=Pedobacter steynii TaxID=430522 RepID=A0A1H0CJU6_9SPHI|nr:RagB/SusD family nutrient uptake outer membrane protein [Pedobacter steynii]NQX41589.1 RagB/SusD family nutrient uptake outer membrane protein [Pedobacter steynii]SDN58113.1 Starch-binding associating with outer membrane [Pedobacter steynii]